MKEDIASRNVKVLIRKSNYSPLWWVWPVVIATGVIGLGSAFWARPVFNDDTARSAMNTLKEKGLDTSGLKIESDYRNLKISGMSGENQTESHIKAALDFKEKGAWNHPIYDIEFDLKTPEKVIPPVKKGPTEVSLKIANEKIDLQGEVLSEKQKEIIYDSAVKRFGKDNVINKIKVTLFAEKTKGSDGRAESLATIIAGVPTNVRGQGMLTDDLLTFEGVANSAKDKPTYQKIFDGIDNLNATMQMQVPEVAKEIDTLDEEFKALSAEIERRVVFKTASAILRPSARSTLNKAVVLMGKYSLPVVAIVGHTDDRGDAVKNKTLSQNRAQTVVDYLVKKGVKMDRLSARGAGAAEPIAPNDSAQGRQKNRRVVFTAKKKF